MNEYHIPVLLDEILSFLVKEKNGIYIDTTFGGGGHSLSLLNKLSNQGRVIAFDKDIDSIKKNNIIDARFNLIKTNYRFIKKIININKVSGILADLGISSHQINSPKRGFSIRYNSILDMRMDPDNKINAQHIINNYSYNELSNLLIRFGEVKNGNNISKLILKHRKKKQIKSTFDLINSFNFFYKKKNKFLSKIFQSLRIEVNDEINALKDLLKNSLSILKPGGRIAVISYHSIEDRIVKKFLKTGNFNGIVPYDKYGNNLSPLILLEPRIIFSSKEEKKENNRSRSAILRIAEKKI
ncbi:rRNA small subunit methyltransferase H [Candidatus Karelsulcia muelleri]|uniref:Ribosomal RNA small subunit methyltransferase H n=1 Tax=Candidatus Karelsulcia muelleri TaxID=336810 RepID=A0A654M655_9FLAO|nr:16S rRNA (cytosine(1402)-N(4))-methyltransferase RsmH [Candidatus Karelsulcia muelleri]AGS33471.1 rRNA small subunit methyltransferase H [Candidatus Karelsulcia muelleri str. Sulcia-ALF]ALP70211.1 rRNA small subunit methyltransferase H [Candidatus Karelsulcia muelleri]QND78457.1 Ribosomal RNA small subunit methyltransferase H [Candidatus Karelsulcia muelleri]